MTATREAVFECTYASAASQRIAHVRAWDAGEAVELFAHELRAEGVQQSGTISVRGGRGARARKSAYPLSRSRGRAGAAAFGRIAPRSTPGVVR